MAGTRAEKMAAIKTAIVDEMAPAIQRASSARLHARRAKEYAAEAEDQANRAWRRLNGLRDSLLEKVSDLFEPEHMRHEVPEIESQEQAYEFVGRFLTEEQKKDLKEQGHFFIVSSKGRPWRLEVSKDSNVALVDSDRRAVEAWCALPRDCKEYGEGWAAAAHSTVAQKVLIEANEDMYLEHAK